MPILSSIKMPNGNSYDLRDNAGLHYLGETSTNVTASSGAVTTIVVGSTTYATNPTSGQEKLRANDLVTYNDLLYVFDGSKWTNITEAASVTDAQIDGTSILDGTVAKIATTGSITGGTAYNASSNPIATQAYVDSAVEDLPQAMIFRGTLGTNATIADLPTASADTVGDVYKVIFW